MENSWRWCANSEEPVSREGKRARGIGKRMGETGEGRYARPRTLKARDFEAWDSTTPGSVM